MSRSNILTQFAIPEIGYFIQFQTRSQGTIWYGFSEAEGESISNGADPASYNGIRINSPADVLQVAGRNLTGNIASKAVEAAVEALGL